MRNCFGFFFFTTSILNLMMLCLLLLSEGSARHYYLGNTDERTPLVNSEEFKYRPEYQECYITIQEAELATSVVESKQLNYLPPLNIKPNDSGQKKVFFQYNVHKPSKVNNTRKIGGQCVKIKDNFHGCVAGSLMDPFHQDCL